MLFDHFKVLVFDLDNTIYPELEYLKRAYCYLSSKVVEEYPCKIKDKNILCEYLTNEFILRGRKGLFQKFIKKFNIMDITIDEMLFFIRSVPIEENSIMIYPEIESIINKYYKEKDIFILTNGNPIQQNNKIFALNIPHKKDIKVIYASSLGPDYEKPNPYYVENDIKNNKYGKDDIIIIGDSQIDEEVSINANVVFKNVNEIIHRSSV